MQRSRLVVFVVTLLMLTLGTLLTHQLPLFAGYQQIATGIDGFYEVSNDGRTFVFAHPGTDPDRPYQLFAVTTENRRPIQLTFEPSGVNPQIFQLTPDGETLVYVAYRHASDVDTLMYIRRIPITGGPSTTIAEVPDGLLQADFENGFLSPDGQYALYQTHLPEELDGAFFSVPVAGGASIRLDTPEIRGTRDRVEVSPDSRWVVLTLYPHPAPFEQAGGRLPLYIVPITGGTPLKVDPTEVGVLEYQFTPDSQTLIFETYTPTDFNQYRLYGIHLDGSGLTQIGSDSTSIVATIPETGTAIFYGQVYSQTGSWDHYEIFKLSALGATPQLLYRDGDTTTTVIKDLTPDFLILNQTQHLSELPWEENYLYSLPTDGSSPAVRLSEDVGNEIRSSILNLDITPDGQTLLYSPVAQAVNPKYLYKVPVNGSAAPTLLYPTQAVYRWHLSPDGSRVFAIIDYLDKQEAVEIALTSAAMQPLFESEPRSISAIDFIPPFADNYQVWLTLHPTNNPFTQTLYLMDSALSNVQFPSNGVLVQEAATPFTTSVTLNAASVTTITAEIQVVGGSATAGVDYTFTPQTVTFAPGETTQPVVLTLLEDAQTEGDETIILEIQAVSGGATGTPIRQTVTIAEALHRQWLPLMKHRR